MQNATLEVGGETFQTIYFMVSDRIGSIAAENRETLLRICATYAGQPAILHCSDDTAIPINLMVSCIDQIQSSGLQHISFVLRAT